MRRIQRDDEQTEQRLTGRGSKECRNFIGDFFSEAKYRSSFQENPYSYPRILPDQLQRSNDPLR